MEDVAEKAYELLTKNKKRIRKEIGPGIVLVIDKDDFYIEEEQYFSEYQPKIKKIVKYTPNLYVFRNIAKIIVDLLSS